jgi:hypothetical protein
MTEKPATAMAIDSSAVVTNAAPYLFPAIRPDPPDHRALDWHSLPSESINLNAT